MCVIDPFLEESVRDGDGVSDAVVGVLPDRVAAARGRLLLALLLAELADDAADAAEQHHAEDDDARHQDLLGGGRRWGRAGRWPSIS